MRGKLKIQEGSRVFLFRAARGLIFVRHWQKETTIIERQLYGRSMQYNAYIPMTGVCVCVSFCLIELSSSRQGLVSIHFCNANLNAQVFVDSRYSAEYIYKDR